MALYMNVARYSVEAFKGMIANPVERETATRTMLTAAGLKLHHMWVSNQGDVVTIVEGSGVSGMAAGMVVMAGGAISSGVTTELFTPEQAVESMKLAGKIAASYKAPGK
jgi:uncharacterized protein with GYD domain